MPDNVVQLQASSVGDLANGWGRFTIPGTYIAIPGSPGVVVALVAWYAQQQAAGARATIQWSCGDLIVTPVWWLTDTTLFTLNSSNSVGTLFEGHKGDPLQIIVGGNLPLVLKFTYRQSG
jgi:hypothetical protein